MKRKFYHPEPTAAESKGPAYWRSLDDLQGSQHFQDWVHREFPDGADTMNEVDRRNFMKIMAASFGLAGAGMTGCRMPERSVFPYAKQPEYLIPGVANYYSTSMPFGSENIPIVVETHQARPTKIKAIPATSLTAEEPTLLLKSAFLTSTTRIGPEPAATVLVRSFLEAR